jgi:putative acetyltransferase
MGGNARGEPTDVAIAVKAVGDDAEFYTLRALFVEYEADLPAHLRHGTVPELAELARTYSGNSRAFLAMADGAAIGCVAVREFDRESALLLRLYVKTARRGLGAARALVGAVIGFAREGRRRRVILDTNKAALDPAYRLYRSMGFVECEPFAAVTYECPTFMELRLES